MNFRYFHVVTAASSLPVPGMFSARQAELGADFFGTAHEKGNWIRRPSVAARSSPIAQMKLPYSSDATTNAL